MPALAFLAVAGLVLTTLLFIANAKLELNSSPAIITSQRTGLPEPQYQHAKGILTETAAPAPDMTSEAVLTAQPKLEPEHRSEPEHHTAIPAEARRARAEVPPKKRPVSPDPIHDHHERNDVFDRFSIKGQ